MFWAFPVKLPSKFKIKPNTWTTVEQVVWYHCDATSSQWFIQLLSDGISKDDHCSDITWLSWHLKSPATQLFIWQLVQVNIRGNMKELHFLPFVRRIHWRQVDSPYKGPVLSCCYHDYANHITIETGDLLQWLSYHCWSHWMPSMTSVMKRQSLWYSVHSRDTMHIDSHL